MDRTPVKETEPWTRNKHCEMLASSSQETDSNNNSTKCYIKPSVNIYTQDWTILACKCLSNKWLPQFIFSAAQTCLSLNQFTTLLSKPCHRALYVFSLSLYKLYSNREDDSSSNATDLNIKSALFEAGEDRLLLRSFQQFPSIPACIRRDRTRN